MEMPSPPEVRTEHRLNNLRSETVRWAETGVLLSDVVSAEKLDAVIVPWEQSFREASAIVRRKRAASHRRAPRFG